MKLMLAVTGIFVVAIFAGCFAVPVARISSPNGSYRIELSGDKSARVIPIGENKITAEIFSKDKRIGKTIIHYADFMDTSFDRTYQRFRWDAENILGFRGVADHEPAAESSGDSLTISNKTSKKINFLNVVFHGNRFLILQLEPNTSQKVYINHSMAPTWIAGEGEFEDESAIKWEGVNFFENAKKANERLHRYCLTVNDTQLRINSIDVKGENLNPSRISPEVVVCGD